ncbi:MAG: sigma-70 family RNA polymerase sigma factor [Oscillospiraceae bacterium]
MVDRDNYIKNNIGLVHSCANKFRNKGIEYDDLFQAGSIGLIKAYDNFDTERGVQFSTYAVPVILGEIKRLFREGGSVKVSRSLKELSLKINRERESYIKNNNDEPTVNYLAEKLEVDYFQIVQAMEVAAPIISLTNSDDDFNVGQIDIKIESEAEKLSDTLALTSILEKLKEEDKKLIMLRYVYYKTQSDTAKILNTTQVQVSRREKKILEKLRLMLL